MTLLSEEQMIQKAIIEVSQQLVDENAKLKARAAEFRAYAEAMPARIAELEAEIAALKAHIAELEAGR